MSSSSDSPRRHTQHIFPEQSDVTKQLEVKRTSRYEIYGTANKPFGESYRRSLVLQQDQVVDQKQDSGHDQEREESQLDADSVEETMGCSASRTEVALNQETVKGNFVNTEEKNVKPIKTEITPKHQRLGEPDIIKEIQKEENVQNNGHSELKSNKLSDFEIIYGTDGKNNNNNGYSITDIYSEVKKSDKNHPNTDLKQTHQSHDQTQREKLMQQIRERKDDMKRAKENEYNKITKVEQNNEESNNKNKLKKDEENLAISDKNQGEKIINTVITSAPVSFVEEEYSYEPEKNEATSKLVVRSRSMHNLDQNQFNYNTTLSCTLKRPNTLKMTTKPDGTIRYGVRQSSSESNLLDDDINETPSQGGEIKNNYVSSIKNAFDAAIIESQAQNKAGKAEAFDGLRQYFHENKHGLQELLTNNNVVIIEPFRHEPPRSPSEKSDSGSFRTCRITGATIKSPDNEQNKILITSNTLPRRNMKSLQNTRQGFYHPIKVNKELIDTELPDPEKVKTARELFEQVVKSRSISEIPSKKPSRPIFNTITSKMKITPEVKIIQGGKQIINEKKRHGRISLEHVMKDDYKRYPIQRRWTDSGSLSSGVSSDFSCDQDFEFHQNEGSNSGSNQEVLEEYSTDEEDLEYNYPYDEDERHPVSSEVLQKIRACGTTVTYYGGKVISRSHGQYRSPMTMTIMDEIRQSAGTSEGRKKFESDSEEPYLGVKFRLVKSHSCGSRLEIAGTEEECSSKLISPRHESFRGKSIAEEVIEVKEDELPAEENDEGNQISSLEEEEEDKAEADRYVTNVEVNSAKNPQVMTWAELKLKEARKQWHCAPEAVRIPSQDMEFETFEVMDESKPHKTDKNETGRG